MSKFLTLLTSCTIVFSTAALVYNAIAANSDSAMQKMPVVSLSTLEAPYQERRLTDPFDGRSVAGNYLASTFAQRRHEWDDSYDFLKVVLERDPDNLLLQKRAMILAVGAGDFDKAVTLSRHISQEDSDSTLALLFQAVDSFERGDFKETESLIQQMKDGSISKFMLPLLESWSAAAQGKNNTANLTYNTMHLYHAILIADFLNDYTGIEKTLEKSLAAPNLEPADKERIGDLYAHIGNVKKAEALYADLIPAMPQEAPILKDKIAALQAGEKVTLFERPESAAQGLAEALYDMARILYEDFNDDSARIFTYLALHLHPDFDNAKLLLGHITARNDQPMEAIAHYASIKPGSDIYLRARYRAAELMEENGRKDEALAELAALARDYDDTEALIQMGDIHRRADEFREALAAYDQAREKLGGEIGENYWHLHYVRGIAYERLGEWDKAEAELKAALNYRPDHPLILNYLGYGWADQGVNLDEALEMIRKAAMLEPEDGYIADSLGWVLYKMGLYKEAIPHLETAVALLPYDPVINDHLGDSYWRTGRKLEAKFQWQRALDNIEAAPIAKEEAAGEETANFEIPEGDEALRSEITRKLASGLGTFKAIKEATATPLKDTETQSE